MHAVAEVRVRRGRVGDEEQLVALTRLIAQAEGREDACALTPEQVRTVVLEEGWAEVLVAVEPDDDSVILGGMIYYRSFPSYSGARGFFLENVAVAPHTKGRGVAKALFDELGREAARLGVTKLEWACHRDNTKARSFYETHVGAVPEDFYMLYALDLD